MEILKNISLTTLNGAIDNSVTSVVVTDGSVFPSTGNFRVIVEDEVMLATARSSNTLTVTRGAEGTAAVSHVDGLAISHALTAGAVEQILADYYQLGGFASRPSSARKGTIYQATDYNSSWRYNGTNWDLISPVYVPYANRMDLSGWSTTNLGTSTTRDVNGIHCIRCQQSSSMRTYYTTLPTAPYTLNLLVPSIMWHGGWHIGIGVRENTTGKLRYITIGNTSNLRAESWTSSTGSVTSLSGNVATQQNNPLWLRFADDNTNWIYSYSVNGKDYSTIYTEARNTGFTADEKSIGFLNNYSIYSTPMWEQATLGHWVT